MSERSISPFERYGNANPNSDATLQIHLFKRTDSITSLAQKYYGDWRLWRVIAERNNLTDVREIEPGTELIIPRRPLERGRYESL
jgi:nucleoid-associated protein YgaU